MAITQALPNSFKKQLLDGDQDFPIPNTSRNCLGLWEVDIGQNRLPTPPAMIKL